MSDVVAKKYTRAVIESFKESELREFVETIGEVESAFKSSKFREIISSSTIPNAKKGEFVMSLLQTKNEKFRNFFKLLTENKRLNLIPEISSGLKQEILRMNNEYSGKVYSKNEIGKDELKNLEEKFSKKFNSTIHLEAVKSDYNGIKIDIEELGVEISFSIDRLKSKMSEYILKAL